MGHLKDTPQLFLSLCEPGSVKKSTLFGSTLDLVLGSKEDLVVGWKPVDKYTHLLCWVDDPEVPSAWFFMWGWTHLATALSNSVLHSVLHSLFSFTLFYYFLYINHLDGIPVSFKEARNQSHLSTHVSFCINSLPVLFKIAYLPCPPTSGFTILITLFLSQ